MTTGRINQVTTIKGAQGNRTQSPANRDNPVKDSDRRLRSGNRARKVDRSGLEAESARPPATQRAAERLGQEPRGFLSAHGARQGGVPGNGQAPSHPCSRGRSPARMGSPGRARGPRPPPPTGPAS